jgi:nitroreductase
MQIDEFLDLVHKRRSIRSFKPDSVPDDYIQKVLEAGRWAMSGANAQPWEFIVIKDRATIKRLAEIYTNINLPDMVELEMHLSEELRQPTIFARGAPGFATAPVILAVIGDQRCTQASVLQAYLYDGQDVLKMALANSAQIMHLAARALGAWQPMD